MCLANPTVYRRTEWRNPRVNSASLPEPETVEACKTKTPYDATATRTIKPVAALRNDLLEERSQKSQDEALMTEAQLDASIRRLLRQALRLHDPDLLGAWGAAERERQGESCPALYELFVNKRAA